MMTEFTASNGVKIEARGREGVYLRYTVGGNENALFTSPEWAALRELFLHERDEQLGRWRWTENPDYVVYPDKDGDVIVVDERNGDATSLLTRITVEKFPNAKGCAAARAFFDAHPEPKPWHDAKDGEIWALTGAGGLEQPWRRLDGKWLSCTQRYIVFDAVLATAGRRIWPPEATS